MTTARSIGALALIDVGAVVYSRDRRHGRDDTPLGGMVVDVVESHVDPSSGEILATGGEVLRAFVTVDPTTLEERVIAEADVDLGVSEPPDPSRMVRVYRRLVRANCVTELVGPQGRRPGKYQDRAGGEFTSHDARRHDQATRLRGALMPRMPR